MICVPLSEVTLDGIGNSEGWQSWVAAQKRCKSVDGWQRFQHLQPSGASSLARDDPLCPLTPPCLPAIQTAPMLSSSALRQITSGEVFVGVAILVGGIGAALDSILASTLKSLDLRFENTLDKRNYEVIGCSAGGMRLSPGAQHGAVALDALHSCGGREGNNALTRPQG